MNTDNDFYPAVKRNPANLKHDDNLNFLAHANKSVDNSVQSDHDKYDYGRYSVDKT